jgi:seryl-tRNA synthetase
MRTAIGWCPLRTVRGYGGSRWDRRQHRQFRSTGERQLTEGFAVDAEGDQAAASDQSDAKAFRDELVAAGHFVLTGTDGLYGHSAEYEAVATSVDDLAIRVFSDESPVVRRFPPVIPVKTFEQTHYLSSFPDLIGAVSTFRGNDRDHVKLLEMADAGGDWTTLLEPSGVTLCPAACHPLYPTLAGTLPEGGRRFDVAGWCYRHEPSVEPTRMQAFRMHEIVFVGESDAAQRQRDAWLERGLEVLGALGLPVHSVVANDPFFGRIGRILASNQVEKALKFEIVTPINSPTQLTAIASANYHLDHFGQPFGIETASGEVAHSCCFGFGVDRIALALLRTHGLRTSDWPAAIRSQLWP